MLPVKKTLLPTVSRFFDDDWNDLFDWSNKTFSLHQSTLPPVNILENKDHFLFKMAAPGMKRSDFSVELTNHQLVIKCECKEESVIDQDHYKRQEFNYNTFQRSFALDTKKVDETKISASYKDGLLSISLPKREEAKDKAAIQIKIS